MYPPTTAVQPVRRARKTWASWLANIIGSKTHGGSAVWQAVEGVYVWRSRHGALYIVDAKGTRKVRGATAQRADQ